MKKTIRLILIIIVIMLLIGCQAIDDSSKIDNNNTNTDVISDVPAKQYTFLAEVMEAGNYLLVTPDKESNEAKSSDKISVNLIDSIITDKNGNEITKEDLKVADIIEITYNGTILESYPAQITASAVKLIDHNIVIDGYLAIIDDIYKEDPGLNGEIEMIAFDTTAWAEVTEVEKEIIFSELKIKYGMDIVEGTYEKLIEDGLVDQEKMYFPKGILITLKDVKYNKDKKTITYSISKWRGGDGAIGSDNAKAKYDGTNWTITKKDMWIS